jgi:Ulp1 family protease
MDSIHRDGRHIFEKLNAYGKYLREYFLGGDQSDFEFVDLKQTIPHQGNGYDCGCHVIWNMIQYISGIKSYRKMPSLRHPTNNRIMDFIKRSYFSISFF